MIKKGKCPGMGVKGRQNAITHTSKVETARTIVTAHDLADGTHIDFKGKSRPRAERQAHESVKIQPEVPEPARRYPAKRDDASNRPKTQNEMK
jgi:hypothetical protein